MSHFSDGFADELVKMAVVLRALKGAGKFIAKRPGKALLAGFIGHGGYSAMKANKGMKRVIEAKPGRPSVKWYLDHHRRLGLKKRLTPLQEERLSRNLAAYRRRQR